jgi:phosphoribosylformylglycinamidine synthase
VLRIGVVTFPGSLDDRDALRAVRLAGGSPLSLWHGDADLHGVDAVVLPGGFSYGDYLRAGAIARFSPVMGEIISAANGGLPVLGICNGFQVLCESHLLPGALTRNGGLRFTCIDQGLRILDTTTPWTSAYTTNQEVVIPVKNGEGQYVGDAERLYGDGLVIASYLGRNPNGSAGDIAGIRNKAGNVVGLMPHPEHAVDPLTGPSTDGLAFFTSVLSALVAA